VGFAAVVQFSK